MNIIVKDYDNDQYMIYMVTDSDTKVKAHLATGEEEKNAVLTVFEHNMIKINEN